jgi:hypothetical protein
MFRWSFCSAVISPRQSIAIMIWIVPVRLGSSGPLVHLFGLIAKELIPAALRTEAAGVPPPLVPHVNLGRDDTEPHSTRAIVAPEFSRLAHELASRFSGPAHETWALNFSPCHGFLDLSCYTTRVRRYRKRDIQPSRSSVPPSRAKYNRQPWLDRDVPVRCHASSY